jgi:hypothetical protein
MVTPKRKQTLYNYYQIYRGSQTTQYYGEQCTICYTTYKRIHTNGLEC